MSLDAVRSAIVVQDRYNGTYAGGGWWAVAGADREEGEQNRIAWLLSAAVSPEGDDPKAFEFWINPPEWIAVADCPDQAIEALHWPNLRQKLLDRRLASGRWTIDSYERTFPYGDAWLGDNPLKLPYPCAALQDRFNGVYSGGPWLAFNLYRWWPDKLDRLIAGDENDHYWFWLERPEDIVAGFTPNEAILKLLGAAGR